VKIKKDIWGLLILPPLFFLFIILGIVFYLISTGLTEDEISNGITKSISTILFTSQLLILFLLIRYARPNCINLFYETFKSANYFKDLIYGTLLGLVISLSYFKLGLIEYVTSLQITYGDYVPAGETSNSVGNNLPLFFLANVLLAPFVEENIYRNIAFKKIQSHYNSTITVLLTATTFGILHWLGGFWYILVTGILIGLPFGIIQLKRKSILLVYIAHLTINLFEFVVSLPK